MPRHRSASNTTRQTKGHGKDHGKDYGQDHGRARRAAKKVPPGTPALPGGECYTPPHESWTEPERWVWEMTCRGEMADFDWREDCSYCPLPGHLVVLEGEEKEKRRLSSRFLEMVLLHEPWREALTRRGLRIVGAWFPEEVELDGAHIKHELWLEKSRFDEKVSLWLARVEASLSLEGSLFCGDLNMVSLRVENHLSMSGQAEFKKDVKLLGAHVGGTLDMDGSSFGGELNMTNLGVESDLFMSGEAEFQKDVDLRSAHIGGQLSMIGSSFGGELNMDSLRVDSSLFMSGKAEFKKGVILRSAHVGGQLAMIGSSFGGELNMNRLSVGTSLFLRDAEIEEDVRLTFSEVRGALLLQGVSLQGKFDLTGTSVDAVICTKEDWPGKGKLKMDGFTYNHLGGMGGGYAGDRMTDWDRKWFIKWLAKQEEYSPQPYEQCAKVLRQAGQPGKSNRVLYEGKLRAQKAAFRSGQIPRWLWLMLFRLGVGHGLGRRALVFPLIWAALIVVGGGLIYRYWATIPMEMQGHSLLFWMGYSLDKFLPIVELSKEHADKFLHGGFKAFLYFQKLAGYGLASLLIASLTGVTKK